VWGHITEWLPPLHLRLAWTMDDADDIGTDVQIDFSPNGRDRTRVEFSHRGWKPHQMKHYIDYRKYWDAVLFNGYQDYVRYRRPCCGVEEPQGPLQRLLPVRRSPCRLVPSSAGSAHSIGVFGTSRPVGCDQVGASVGAFGATIGANAQALSKRDRVGGTDHTTLIVPGFDAVPA